MVSLRLVFGLAFLAIPSQALAQSQKDAHLVWMWQFNAVAFNGSYTGSFASEFTFAGSSVPGAVDVIGTVMCEGRNVPTPGWDGGAIEMECNATFPASDTHGPLTWWGTGGGYANYDGLLVKGSGKGTYTDDTGTHESPMEVFSFHPWLVAQ